MQLNLLTVKEQTLFEGVEVVNPNKYYKYDYVGSSVFLSVENAKPVFIKEGIEIFYEYVSDMGQCCHVYEAVTGISLSYVVHTESKVNTIKKAIEKATELLNNLEEEGILKDIFTKALQVTQGYSPRYKGPIVKLMKEHEDLQEGDTVLMINVRGALSQYSATVLERKDTSYLEYRLEHKNGFTFYRRPNANYSYRDSFMFLVERNSATSDTDEQALEITLFDDNELDKCINDLIAAKNDLEDYLANNSIPFNISKALKMLSDTAEFDKLFSNKNRYEQKVRTLLLNHYNMKERLSNTKDIPTYQKLMAIESEMVLFFVTDKENNILRDREVLDKLKNIKKEMSEYDNNVIEVSNQQDKEALNIDYIKAKAREVLDREKSYLQYIKTTDYYKENVRKSALLMCLDKTYKAFDSENIEDVELLYPKKVENLIGLLKNLIEPPMDLSIVTTEQTEIISTDDSIEEIEINTVVKNGDVESDTIEELRKVLEDNKEVIDYIHNSEYYNDIGKEHDFQCMQIDRALRAVYENDRKALKELQKFQREVYTYKTES